MRFFASIIVRLLIAVAVSLALVVLAPASHEWLSGGILLPLFFLWWVIADHQIVPWWWVLFVVSTVDALTFTPRGGFVSCFFLATATLALMDHLMPSHRLSSALISASITSVLLMSAESGILFAFLAPPGAVIPWQSTFLSAFAIMLTTDLSLIVLWPFRHRQHFIFAM